MRSSEIPATEPLPHLSSEKHRPCLCRGLSIAAAVKRYCPLLLAPACLPATSMLEAKTCVSPYPLDGQPRIPLSTRQSEASCCGRPFPSFLLPVLLKLFFPLNHRCSPAVAVANEYFYPPRPRWRPTGMLLL